MPRSVYNSSWVPDLTPEQLSFEKGWLLGEILCAMAYGVVLALFPICFYLLCQQRSDNPRQKMILLVYITTVFILNTLFLGGNTQFTLNSFIDFREYPGGPGQFEQDMFSITADEVANVAYVIANWLSDIILVWRCYVVFLSMGGQTSMWIVMTIAGLIYAGSIVTGLGFLIQISATSPFGSAGGVNWTVPYFTVSMALTVYCTAAIVVRVLLYRRRVRQTLGERFAGQYLSLASMMVESGLIWTVYSLVFVITFELESPASVAFLQSLNPVQTIASLLILFRVARGKSWDSNASTTINMSSSGARSGGTIPMFVVRKPNQTYEERTTRRDSEIIKPKTQGVLVEREVMMDYSRSQASESPLDQKL